MISAQSFFYISKENLNLFFLMKDISKVISIDN